MKTRVRLPFLFAFSKGKGRAGDVAGECEGFGSDLAVKTGMAADAWSGKRLFGRVWAGNSISARKVESEDAITCDSGREASV